VITKNTHTCLLSWRRVGNVTCLLSSSAPWVREASPTYDGFVSQWSVLRQWRPGEICQYLQADKNFKPLRSGSVQRANPSPSFIRLAFPSAPFWSEPLITLQLDPNTGDNARRARHNNRNWWGASLAVLRRWGFSRAEAVMFFIFRHTSEVMPPPPPPPPPQHQHPPRCSALASICFVKRNRFILLWRCSGGCTLAYCVCVCVCVRERM